jgi:hypothetical protein
VLATAAQFSLVCVFLGGAFIKLFSTEADSGDSGDAVSACGGGEGGSDSSDVLGVVIIMVSFNFGMLILYVVLAAYQFTMTDVLPSIRQVNSGRPPKLFLSSGQKFHLFLSHIWSSGQDQMATVKRELQLLLYDVKVFLGEPHDHFASRMVPGHPRWTVATSQLFRRMFVRC